MRNRHIPPDSLHTSQPCSKGFTDVQLVKYPVPCGEKEIFDLAVIMRKGLAQNMGIQPSASESQVTIDNSSFTRLNSIFDVLIPNYNSEEYKPEVIMIEGAPGMGKSTVCKEIAYQWAQNQSLIHLKLVLFLSLENVMCDSIKTLEDLILYFYNFDETAADFVKQCACILQQRSNDDILIILDGYNISQDSPEDSFLTQIVRRKVLRHSKIIITPQGICTSKLQNFVNMRIEILGFSDENKKEYFKNEFKNHPNKIEVLSSYLSTNKTINGVCYIPMVMDILVQAYKETEELPDDQTQLYQKIICHVIIRYLNKHGEGKQTIQCPNLLLQHLPDVCKSYILNLSEVAFNLLKCDKATFTDADFKIVNPTITQYKSILGLGLLKSTEHLQADNMNVGFFHNFLHSSIQELLAAYYVTSQEASNQFELLKNTFFIHEYTNMWIVFVSLYKHAFSEFSDYSAYCQTHQVLKNLIGEIKNLDILHSFRKLINECISSSNHETLQFFGFRATETKYYNTLCLKNTADELSLMNKLTVLRVSWNKVYISLYPDSNSDMEVTETFIIDSNMQENAYSRLASDLNENKDLSVMMVNVSSVLGYRANKQQFSSGLNMNDSITNLVLRDCFLSDEVSVMMSSYIEKSKLKVAVFVGCSFSSMGIKNIFNSLGHIATIEIMVIGNMDINEEASIAIASAIANNPKMFYLEIVNCHLQNEAACQIITALRNISSLGTLILEKNNFSKDTTDDLATAVSVNCRLKKLKLANNNLQHHAVVLTQALSQVKSLTDLDLSNNNMTDKVVDALALAIENNSSLQRVNLRGNALKTNGIMKIAQSLSWNSRLKVLDICNNQITEDAADAIAIAFLSNTSLEELYLDNNSLALGVKTLSATLKEISTLKILDLDNNNVPDDAADQLAAVVCNNKNLEKIFLMNNNLKLGAMKIFWALSKITTLTVLNLSKNGMTEMVACSLAAAIESNRSLTTIKLSSNKLQTQGIITISQSLRKLSSLEVLHIDDNQINKAATNDIASVILSNTCLRELYLNDNDLQDGIIEIADALKHNSALQKLVLNDNNMSENVSEALADALKNLCSLKIFAAMNNKLTTKAVITIAKSLRCLSQLTMLNIHNNQFTKQAEDAIASVIQSNKKLEELYLGQNDLVGAGRIIASLKHTHALKTININGSAMFEEVAKDLHIALANKHSLNVVGLEGNYLKTVGIITVSKSLRCVSNITLLNLHDNHLTEEAGEALASVILNNAKLEDLYLGNNKLQAGALKVIQALKHISTLKVLDLNDNIIPEYVADELASVIESNSSLSSLRLRSNKFKVVGTVKISRSLAKLTTLRLLNIRNNGITEEASEAIASVLLSNTEIQELYLGCNYLEGGIVKILTALKNNSVLKVLDLDSTNTSRGLESKLISILQSNTLRTLWLAKNSFCSFKNACIEGLHSCMKLTELDISDNFLSGKVAQECVAAIISNSSSLESIKLQNNCFSTDELLQILQSISKLSTLKLLNLKGNVKTPALANIIALVFENNAGLEEIYLNCDYLQQDISKITGSLKSLSRLKVLDMCGGNLSEKVVQDITTVIQSNCMQTLRLIDYDLKLLGGIIAQAINHITSLTVLNLSCNCISEEAAKDLAVAMTSNQSLKELRLVDNCLKTSGTVVILQALSNLSKLKILNIRRNYIDSSQELVDAMAKTVSNNRRLENLCLGENNYSNHGIQVVSTLRNISTLVLLYLNDMQLSDDVTLANSLATVIRNNCLLEHLYLANNFLSHSLIAVAKACKEYSKNLKILDLRSNSVASVSLTSLVMYINGIVSLDAVFLSGLTLNSNEMIYSHLVARMKNRVSKSAMYDQSKILEYLTLEVQNNDISIHIKHLVNSLSIPTYYVQNFYTKIWDMLHISQLIDNSFLTTEQYQISEIDATNLVYFLTILRKLKVIDLELLNIDENAAFELAAAIQCNGNLKQLWLRSNTLNATGALFIFNSLKCISSLKVLDISNNNIGHQLSDNVAAVISRNCLLEQLWLDGNALLSKGIVRISNALSSLSTLRTLSLCNNGITDDAADEISTIIANNTYLEDLQLSGNLLTSAGVTAIAESCKKLFRLRKLDLFNNKISKDAADILADAISNCYNLQELYLSYNMLESSGTIKILQALKVTCKLQILTLSNNNIDEEVADDLTDVLINNNMFYILLIGGNNLQTRAAMKIANVIRNHNESMQLFGVCDNNICEHGKDEIIKIFSTTTRLRLYV